MTQREKLVAMVRASGQEVIDRAEDIVGEGETITDIDIWLRFSPTAAPGIEVTRSYISRRGCGVLLDDFRSPRDTYI